MDLGDDLRVVAACAPAAPDLFTNIRRHVDPAWLEEALAWQGDVTLRRRRLPAAQVVWLVLGLALFRDRPIAEVLARLDLAVPTPDHAPVVPSAIAQARARLGVAPLAYLFARTATAWAARLDAPRWRGLTVLGVDGTTLRTPDTAALRAALGTPRDARGVAGAPQLRVVALLDLRTRLAHAATLGGYHTSEMALAEDLWPCVPDDAVVVLDRLYINAAALYRLHAHGTGRHYLVRAKTRVARRVVATHGPGDEHWVMTASAVARRSEPALGPTWSARAVTFTAANGTVVTLLTSLLDPVAYPAAALIALYRERWEHEGAYDELKTELLAAPLRSQTPAGVRQEGWGVLLAYNLVRVEMAHVARAAGVAALRVSFVTALRAIRDEWLWAAVARPGSIPAKLRRLRATLVQSILPARRARAYPRTVRQRCAKYRRTGPRALGPPP